MGKGGQRPPSDADKGLIASEYGCLTRRPNKFHDAFAGDRTPPSSPHAARVEQCSGGRAARRRSADRAGIYAHGQRRVTAPPTPPRENTPSPRDHHHTQGPKSQNTARPADAWLMINNKVYDVSGWHEHPGGDVIFTSAGDDATDPSRCSTRTARPNTSQQVFDRLPQAR